MSTYPIAASVREALTEGLPRARTAEAAAAIAQGPVFLAVETLPDGYASLKALEAAAPALYTDACCEAAFEDGAWRVVVRYWRPAPPAPVARTPELALRRPLGAARTPEEARAVLGGPAELASEILPRLYRTRGMALARARPLAEVGLADDVEREGRFALAVRFWRPLRSNGGALLPAERAEIAARLSQPMRGQTPQSDPFVGLFERLAPENPVIVLTDDEGDGRTRGE